MLLSTQLFGDKTVARVHLRWLPFLARLEDMGTYSWGSAALALLCWNLCWCTNRNVVQWSRYLPTSDEKDPRLVQYRLFLDRVQQSKFVWKPYLTPEVDVIVHPSIFEHHHVQLWTARQGRVRGDRWFPTTYQTWHGDWDFREEHVMIIHKVRDPAQSKLYLQWWFMAGKKLLLGDAAHADSRMTDVPLEASQRVPTQVPPRS
ncbi:hypothetical protein PIB30_086714 [Stylosanthes scabra]|uniref:Aminotransferase-like plant mobile domain-containing protein n=1 Tax=Stylosanthes scabra TaxID=79078 RepID=A0ABU6TTT9_9FABA|nr:hypothetical protein [Stylosanthes scabra]